MRWTAALLLALGVHLAGVGICWLCRHAVEGRTPALFDHAVEVVIAPAAVPAPEPPPEPPRQAKSRPTPRPKPERAQPSAAPISDPVADARAPVSAAAAVPAAPAAPRVAAATPPDRAPSSLLDLRPRDQPSRLPPAPAGADLKIDLNLHPHDDAIVAAPPADAADGQIIESPGLRAQVARDGTMRVRDRPPVTLGSDLTSPVAVVKDWLKDPAKHAAARDGTVAIVSGKFDVTDVIMRAAGQDPYRAQRMKMLDETRERRLTLAARDRTVRQGQELAALPATLRNIWNDNARTVAERRRVLFQLWDECQEGAEGESESAAAGGHARRIIILFVRAQVREGSSDAYPKGELAMLNQMRQSRQRFDPYGASVR